MKVVLLTALATLVGCASWKSSAPERNPANHTWANYHWATTKNPSTLLVGDCLSTTDWKNHLRQSSTDWNNHSAVGATSTPILTAVTNCGTTKKTCTMIKGTTQVCNGTYGNNGWLGLASINISGDHITQGSSKMNDTYFKLAKYNNPNEKLHVMCQELAHTFGLGHQSEDGSSQNSCMDYFSNTGIYATSTLSTKPNYHDFEELNALYDHLETTGTMASGAIIAINSPQDLDNPKKWGKLVSQSSNGRGSWYEKHHSDGSVTVTHVYWTEEKAAKCPQCDHRDH